MQTPQHLKTHHSIEKRKSNLAKWRKKNIRQLINFVNWLLRAMTTKFVKQYSQKNRQNKKMPISIFHYIRFRNNNYSLIVGMLAQKTNETLVQHCSSERDWDSTTISQKY
jgi:hypothetical protein